MTTGALLPSNWGIRPVLFSVGKLEVPSYGAFMVLAVATGIFVYYREAAKRRTASENTFYILIAALAGGALGAKIPILILYWREIISQHGGWSLLVSGRSIVGGLIGGAISVILLKRALHINERKGDLFAPAIALGIAIGRIGCLLRGCCYGTPTSLPWGVNFGDGIPRHPTQLYEALFMLATFAGLVAIKNRVAQPGGLFRILMVAYFSCRFAVEFIRVEGGTEWGLTFFQWISLGAVAWYGKDAYLAVWKQKGSGEYAKQA
jgi:phosphatidylglycerol---prolipoprotein diacylglyceryl transferase